MKNIPEQTAEITTIPKGYRAYKIKGVDRTIVAKKGGPSDLDVKSKESYKELRNNQKEFGIASMLSKTLRQSLSPCMIEICETYSSGKLTAKFRSLAKLEEGKTGTRPMCPSKHGHHLSGFEFNNDAPYDKIFEAKYHVKQGSRKGQVILHFPAFVPEKSFLKPDEATNFKINARLIALSDYDYISNESAYHPSNEDAHGSFGSWESPMLPVLKIPTEPMTSQISLPNLPLVGERVGLFLIMAISFFRYENGRFHHLPKSSSMHIHEVY